MHLSSRIRKNHTDGVPLISLRLGSLICIYLVLIVIAVYAQTRGFDFIDYDDDLYVVENEHVKRGLTLEGIKWAFVAHTAANWHPLTLISHMADVEFFGMQPGWHHITNVFFHLTNTILLFVVLSKTTGQKLPSAFVAVLFGIHPLHLDSVVQIAERKDVLSTFFWMMTVWAYSLYTEKARRSFYYLASLILYALGLMVKPMLVTLPFTLLLLDYWPLSRIGRSGSWSHQTVPYLVLEKIPFFLLSAISCIVTFMVQNREGAVQSIKLYTIDIRVANAIVTYLKYIIKTIFPAHLSFYYPHHGMPPLWQTLVSAVTLACISILVVRTLKSHPYLIVGWLWYLGTLVPVIGLVQVGSQAMADRYTYVPLIGLFIMITWGVTSAYNTLSLYKKQLAVCGSLLTTVLMIVAWWQAEFWRDSETLFKRAISVTEKNTTAHLNLGFVFAEQGKIDEALFHYKEVINISPHHEKAHHNIGLMYAKKGRLDEAIFHYRYVLKQSPGKEEVVNDLAVALAEKGAIEEAIKEIVHGLDHSEDSGLLLNTLGVLLFRNGNLAEAVRHFKLAIRVQPDYQDARNNLKRMLSPNGKIDQAIEVMESSLKVSPTWGSYFRLGVLQKIKGDLKTARTNFEKAIVLQPTFAEARDQLALVNAMLGNYEEALVLYKKMIWNNPQNFEPYYSIASILSRQKKLDLAMNWLQKAMEFGFDDWDRIRSDPNLRNLRLSKHYRRSEMLSRRPSSE